MKFHISTALNKMKKTPADFATAPTVNALQALVAVAALSGVASSITSTAQATEGSQATYNPSSQKSVGLNGIDLATVTTTATQSYQIGGFGTDDAKSTQDVF